MASPSRATRGSSSSPRHESHEPGVWDPEAFVDAMETLEDFDFGIMKPISFGPDYRKGIETGVLMRLLPGREETTSLWGNFEIIDPDA